MGLERAASPLASPPEDERGDGVLEWWMNLPSSRLSPRSSLAERGRRDSYRVSVSICVNRWLNSFSLSRSEEHTSELQSPCNLVCRLLLEKKKKTKNIAYYTTIYHTMQC